MKKLISNIMASYPRVARRSAGTARPRSSRTSSWAGSRPPDRPLPPARRPSASKASIIYKATGNLRAVQILLGHAKIENTVRYLGVAVYDALTLAEI